MRANTLVLGKDQELVRVITRLLRGMGFAVLTAENKDDIEDLIPIMSLTLCVVVGFRPGVEMIEMVRKLSPSTKIIATSGSGSNKDPMLVAGADSFIPQVFGIDELLALIRSLDIRIPNDPDPSS